MASSILFVFLSLLHIALSLPYAYTQSTRRLIGNKTGVLLKNLTYDDILGSLSHVHILPAYPKVWRQTVPVRGILSAAIDRGRGYGRSYHCGTPSENPSFSVAVIEAGGFYEIDNGNVSQVPGYDVAYAYPSGGTMPLVDWGFKTEPQKVMFAWTSTTYLIL